MTIKDWQPIVIEYLRTIKQSELLFVCNSWKEVSEGLVLTVNQALWSDTIGSDTPKFTTTQEFLSWGKIALLNHDRYTRERQRKIKI